MQWSGLDDFLSMGGHGVFVWGSYGLTFALLALEAVHAAARHRRARVALGRSGSGA